MRACYNIQTCSGSALEEDIALCAKAGFSGVEICFDKAKNYLKTHTMQEIGSLLKRHNMVCETLNAIFDISFCTPDRWERVRKEFEYACDLGAACDCHKVIVLSSERADIVPGNTVEQIREDTIQVLHRLADLGGPQGMQVCFEPVGTMAVGDIGFAWEIVQAVGRPEVGLVLDDFNLFLWDLGADFDLIRKVDPEKISIVHINDAESIPFAMLDQDHRCMPGDGRVDVAHYMECVRAAGYDGAVSVEVLNSRIWEKGARVIIPEAYEKLKAYF